MTSSNAPLAFVIGQPIAHSRSPLLHGYWLKALGMVGAYERREVSPEGLPRFFAEMRDGHFAGCNVTVPHKEKTLSLVEEATAAARAIGAVNTVWREYDRLIGDNTDAYGFLTNLDERAPGWDSRGRQAVVLGAGGAARAVVFSLLSRGFHITILNRTTERAEALARQFGAQVAAASLRDMERLLGTCDLLVNTTSLGMQGKPALELDLAALRAGAIVNDIVYVPLETALLRTARARGHVTIDGLGMLIHQAVPGFERWFGARPVPDADLRAILEADIAATG